MYYFKIYVLLILYTLYICFMNKTINNYNQMNMCCMCR